MGVLRIYFPGAGVGWVGSRVASQMAAQALEKDTTLGERREAASLAAESARTFAPYVTVARNRLNVAQGHGVVHG